MRRVLESYREAERAAGSCTLREGLAPAPARERSVRSPVPGTGTESGFIGTMTGHFAVFNRWTLIDSLLEGRFLEQIAPGAFTQTIAENKQGMRVLLNHGRDPQLGMKPLGPIRKLEEDNVGARYEVPLFDTSYNRDLLPALKGSQYGASFRFVVMREEVNTPALASERNPDRIEERTILEAKVREFGPVTFPAYEAATAFARSQPSSCGCGTSSSEPARSTDVDRRLRRDQPWRIPPLEVQRARTVERLEADPEYPGR